MAIVQISQIQVRRGLQQDLPQLASGEMGWSTDSRRLYIGNGVTGEPDYAPSEGVTEVLTQYSNFLSTISNYTFTGTDSGYTSRTGPSSLAPVARTLQSVLDDIVSVRDFGAVGDGLTDNTDAINRAIQEIYPSLINGSMEQDGSTNPVYFRVRRAIKFPAGTYIISGPILVPPNCTLIGDGKNNTVIASTTGTALITCDANFQTGGSMSGVFPSSIFISGMQFSTAGGTSAVAQLNSVNNITFDQVYFRAKDTSSVTNLVTAASSFTTTQGVTFRNCVFDGGTHGFATASINTIVIGVNIANSLFINNSTAGINITGGLSGLVSEKNYFDSTVATPIIGLSGNNFSYSDMVTGVTSGATLGTAKIGSGNTYVLSTGTNDIAQLDSGGGLIDYQLTAGSDYRYGTIKYNKSVGGTASFDDDFTEPTVGIDANLFINHDGNLSCTVSTTTTFKYNIKQFV